MTDYGLLAKQIVSLAEVDAHWLPVLSNAAALLWDALDDINWAGFYLVDPVTVTSVEPDAGWAWSRTRPQAPTSRALLSCAWDRSRAKLLACAFPLVRECVARLRKQRQVSW